MSKPKNETPEQRAARLAYSAANYARRKAEDPEGIRLRRAEDRARSRAADPEGCRLKLKAAKHARLASETPDQRARRLAQGAEYRARKLAEDPEGYRSKAVASTKKYVATHPAKANAATKKWRLENLEAVNRAHRTWRSRNIIRSLVSEAKSRAKTRGVAFEITVDDVPPMGTHCPLLGHPFPPPDVRRTPFSPSLDRIDPTRGYVPGNVWLVGYRANLIKNDGTADEHEMIARAVRARLAR